MTPTLTLFIPLILVALASVGAAITVGALLETINDGLAIIGASLTAAATAGTGVYWGARIIYG